jgi:hypothetical protein
MTGMSLRPARPTHCLPPVAAHPVLPGLGSSVRVLAACVALACGQVGCRGHDARLDQHRKSLESLGATTAATVDGWLGGQVSGTYARATLERTLQLVDQERSALATSPEMLQDPRGAALSERAERLSRLLAALLLDVASANGPSARQHAGEIPIRPGARP